MAGRKATSEPKRVDWITRAKSLAIVWTIRVPRLLPYPARMRAIGWLMAHVFGPLAGYRKRIRANLAHVCPDLPEAEIRRLCRAVPANAGRMLMEISSPVEFKARLAGTELQGAGAAAIESARQEGRPIIAVTGHFGNFDAPRAALAQRGHQIGALYRPINDPYLDRAFYDALTGIAAPIFPRGRQGLGQMLRFLRKGNMVALVMDQYVHGGAKLTFFGKTAPTSLSAAEMALKYKALLVPIYGIRHGLDFEIVVESPIEHTDPVTMMQEVNDSLERQVRAHMDQWLWIHRRWRKS